MKLNEVLKMAVNKGDICVGHSETAVYVFKFKVYIDLVNSEDHNGFEDYAQIIWSKKRGLIKNRYGRI